MKIRLTLNLLKWEPNGIEPPLVWCALLQVSGGEKHGIA